MYVYIYIYIIVDIVNIVKSVDGGLVRHDFAAHPRAASAC